MGPGSTVIPIIISSDKTQLTTFRNITAYPVYLTIGDLPKHVLRKPSRQAQVLLAYLPATKLDSITNKAARKRSLANLFHQCMGHVLHPLVTAGKDGMDLVSGDGTLRHGHPILATYVGDYPEQPFVTLIKTGWCPTCPAVRDDLGEDGSASPPRDVSPILRTLEAVNQGQPPSQEPARQQEYAPFSTHSGANSPSSISIQQSSPISFTNFSRARSSTSSYGSDRCMVMLQLTLVVVAFLQTIIFAFSSRESPRFHASLAPSMCR